jgi:hypothetical protein
LNNRTGTQRVGQGIQNSWRDRKINSFLTVGSRELFSSINGEAGDSTKQKAGNRSIDCLSDAHRGRDEKYRRLEGNSSFLKNCREITVSKTPRGQVL